MFMDSVLRFRKNCSVHLMELEYHFRVFDVRYCIHIIMPNVNEDDDLYYCRR